VVLTDFGVWFDKHEAALPGRIAQPVMRPMCGVGRIASPKIGRVDRPLLAWAGPADDPAQEGGAARRAPPGRPSH
jgi:hypothetical protein